MAHAKHPSEPNPILARLEEEIARYQQTIEQLKATGHPCPDAEKELQRLKENFALLQRK